MTMTTMRKIRQPQSLCQVIFLLCLWYICIHYLYLLPTWLLFIHIVTLGLTLRCLSIIPSTGADATVDLDQVMDITSTPATPTSTRHVSMISLNAETSLEFKDIVSSSAQGMSREKSTDCLLPNIQSSSQTVSIWMSYDDHNQQHQSKQQSSEWLCFLVHFSYQCEHYMSEQNSKLCWMLCTFVCCWWYFSHHMTHYHICYFVYLFTDKVD